jgi:hypothetical protein
MNIFNFIIRRVSLEVLDRRFMNSLDYGVQVFLNKKKNAKLKNFKELVVTDLMDDIHPILQRHYQGDEDIYEVDEISNGIYGFLHNYYDDIMTDTYQNEIQPDMKINESKKLLRRFPLEEIDKIFNRALKQVSREHIDPARQNYKMSYLDFVDEVMSWIMTDIYSNHDELYEYYKDNQFEFMDFFNSVYGDKIFNRYLNLSKVK